MKRQLEIGIQVRVHQDGDEMPYAIFKSIMRAINTAALYSERSDFRSMQQALPDLPAQAVNDALELLREGGHYLDSAILVRDIRPGSMVVSVTVAGLAVWLLDKTLGASVGEAWKQTDMHKRIIDLLTKKSKVKRELIENRLKFYLKKMVPCEVAVESSADREFDIFEGNNNIFIDVQISGLSDKFPPNRKNILWALPENNKDGQSSIENKKVE